MSYRYLTDLAAACRKSGLTVIELDGWKTRGRSVAHGQFNPKGIVVHHTAGPQNGMAATPILVNGRAGLPGPLSQLSLDRQGRVYVIAAGRSNHAGTVRQARFMAAGDGNAQSIGIEAQNTGYEGWTSTQLAAYHRLCAALCDHYGWGRGNVVGHGECSTAGKWDPGKDGKMLSMTTFRAAVAAVKLNGQAPAPAHQITMATYNVVAEVHHAGQAAFKTRVPYCVDLLEEAGADLIAIQEGGDAGTHKPMRTALEKIGYELVVLGAWRGLYLNTETMDRKSGWRQGLWNLKGHPEGGGKSDTKGCVYGLVRHKASGQRFIGLSAHLENEAQYDNWRWAQGAEIRQRTKSLMRSLTPNPYPVLLGMDANSSKSVVDRFVKAGWTSGETAQEVISASYDTLNRLVNPPRRFHDHIDHVVALPGHTGLRPVVPVPQRWEQFGNIKNGLYVKPFPSDHNPVAVTFGF